MSNSAHRFEGWVAQSPQSAEGNLVWQEFEPKEFEDDDVDIKITHCGVDGSDLHVLRGGWGPCDYPMIAGHEIVGNVVRIGKNVTDIKVGDRVGVGAQSGSCLRHDCSSCANGFEQHCRHMIFTYNSKWSTGDRTYGGYATYWRGDGRFVIRIPDGISSREAAPMLCGGVTMYAPLKQNDVGLGKRVGIVGIGGLGHFGLLFAKALGASKVCAISRTDSKKDDAFKLGADYFIATGEKDWQNKYANMLDLIISTVSSPSMPLSGYLSLLDVGGTFVQVGAPEDALPQWNAFSIIAKRVKICGSLLGSRDEIRDMLQLAVDKQVHPWIQDRPLEDVNQALIDFEAGKPRYRLVLQA